ncbi:hypothetical protein R3P38DRAFT_2793549 [Favolaschia claudopus]|uniref:Uncharacterized protein n=1 Tax=Favolaschia claudopus TaxID=2862362 RepID=A0AAW0ACB5_9AGAR
MATVVMMKKKTPKGRRKRKRSGGSRNARMVLKTLSMAHPRSSAVVNDIFASSRKEVFKGFHPPAESGTPTLSGKKKVKGGAGPVTAPKPIFVDELVLLTCGIDSCDHRESIGAYLFPTTKNAFDRPARYMGRTVTRCYNVLHKPYSTKNDFPSIRRFFLPWARFHRISQSSQKHNLSLEIWPAIDLTLVKEKHSSLSSMKQLAEATGTKSRLLRVITSLQLLPGVIRRELDLGTEIFATKPLKRMRMAL